METDSVVSVEPAISWAVTNRDALHMGRVIPGVLMVLGWLLLLFFGSALFFALVVCVVAAIGLFEYFLMVDQTPGSGTGIITVGICLLPVAAACSGSPAVVLMAGYLVLLSLVLLVLFQYRHLKDGLAFLSTAGFAAFYISLCSAYLVLIRLLPDGASWLLLLTAITAGSDIGAYYTGRVFGRKKLCFHISPGKTVNGAVGGILAATIAAVPVAFFLLPGSSVFKIIPAAAVLAGIGICGDLAESIIKRSCGVKDAGTLLGAHGGVLDRVDSLLLTTPLLYILLYYGVLS